MPRTVDRETRHAELVEAAARVFARRGVANTAVSHVVKEAGVAQGTFYLYFDSRDDVVSAVAERLVATMLEGVAAAPGGGDVPAVERFLALTEALAQGVVDPGARDVVDFVHRPENRAVHDRMAEHLMPRLGELCESIVADGVAEGVFSVADPRAAAWFVLGGLHGAELSGASTDEMPAAIREAGRMALRALGAADATEPT